MAAACSKVMFSSCAPSSALVAGVKMGSGRRLALRSPAGSGTPHTAPPSWYSFQPEPARYPRTTASMGRGFRRLTSIERPRTCSISSGATTLSGAWPVRWWGTMCESRSNQNSATRVSSSPLPGMGSPMITSKAEMRSLATISSRSAPTA